MHRTALLLFALLTTTFSFCQTDTFSTKPIERWDLKKAVEYAMLNNISVRQQDVQAKVARLNYKASDLSKYPSLNLSTGLGVNTGRSIDPQTNQFTTQSIVNNNLSLQSSVELFNWFSKQNTIAGYKYDALAADANVDKLKNDIALNIAAAYLQALLAKAQVNASRLQISQRKLQVDNTRKQVDAGSLPELNLLQLESQLATDSFNLVSAMGSEVQSLLFIKSLLNLDAALPFDITTPPIELIPIDPIAELQPEFVYQLALKNLPQQRVNELKLKAAVKYASAAHGALYPTFSIGASLGSIYSGSKNNFTSFPRGLDTVAHVFGSNTPVVREGFNVFPFTDPYGTQLSNNFNSRIGINLSVPIFNGNSARINWQKQKLNVVFLQLQQDLDNASLKQNIYKAFSDAMTALQKLSSSKKAMETAQKAYDFSLKRYNVGLLSTIDLIINQNNLFTANINQLSAEFDYVFKMKVLEFYKGEGLKL
jgi:outer membrane protein